MAVATEGARAYPALTAWRSISTSRLPVSLERPGRRTGSAGNSPTPGLSSGETAPVVKGSAAGVIPAAVKPCVMVMPVETPMTPSPAKTSEPTDGEPDSKREIRATKPYPRIRIPPGPRHNGISVNEPRVICRNVHDIRFGRLNGDVRILCRYFLLRRTLQIAGVLRFLAHELYRIHHILLLVVIGITERRRP